MWQWMVSKFADCQICKCFVLWRTKASSWCHPYCENQNGSVCTSSKAELDKFVENASRIHEIAYSCSIIFQGNTPDPQQYPLPSSKSRGRDSMDWKVEGGTPIFQNKVLESVSQPKGTNVITFSSLVVDEEIKNKTMPLVGVSSCGVSFSSLTLSACEKSHLSWKVIFSRTGGRKPRGNQLS